MSYTSSLCFCFLVLVVLECWAQQAERPPPEGPRRPLCSYHGTWGSWSSCKPLGEGCGSGTQGRDWHCTHIICPTEPDVGVTLPVPERGPAPAPAYPTRCIGTAYLTRSCEIPCPKYSAPE